MKVKTYGEITFMNRLVVIGSLHENVELVAEAKRRGYYVIVCDGYENGPAKQIANKYYNIDVRDVDSISKICIKEKANGIIGSFSDLVFEQITKIAYNAGMKWYATPDMLKYYRNKNEQKKLLQRIGIATPKHRLINMDFSENDILQFQFPVLVKPTSGWGSKNITVFNTINEMEDIFCFEKNRDGNFEIEEYCDAFEYNCIAWVTSGRINILGIADRERNPRSNNSIKPLNRVVYPSIHFEQLHDKVLDVLQKFVNETGQKSGPISMQFFYKDDTIYVCEIAGRILAHEHELIKMCGGTDITSLLLDYVYHDDLYLLNRIKKTEPNKFACGLYFLCEQNKQLTDTSITKELLKEIPEKQKLFFCDEGQVFDASCPYYARIYLQSNSKTSLDNQTKFLFKNMCVKDANNKNVIIPFVLEKRR